jgi:hypothetical protein
MNFISVAAFAPETDAVPVRLEQQSVDPARLTFRRVGRQFRDSNLAVAVNDEHSTVVEQQGGVM